MVTTEHRPPPASIAGRALVRVMTAVALSAHDDARRLARNHRHAGGGRAMTTTTPSLDEARIEQFAGQVFGLYVGGMMTYMVDLGYRTGLFDAAAAGPATSAELADRSGLEERYVREWLGAMATGGIVDYDAASRTYTLPPEHAACLTGTGSSNLARFSQLVGHVGKHLPKIERAFREGGGVPYEEFRPEFTDVMDISSRNVFDEHLVAEVLPLAGLSGLLERGARVADIGCGTGHAVVLMARAFPASTFVGYDLAEDAIARARAEAAGAGVTNAQFEVRDVARLTVDEPFDVVCSFDTIHDQVDPVAVLTAVASALAPGGTYLMVEPNVSSNLEDNIGNPLAPLVYSVSTLHCLTVSLAHGGAGLGTAWGEQKARELLAGAGFVDIEVHPAPGDPLDGVFVAHKAVAA
jgi:2-polyprenyl-3-methyl-5-hydroxy-6-metoxy-1,4-benzoquinol methylase